MSEQMFSRADIENYRLWLNSRLKSKRQIIKAGGQQALAHTPKDISRILFALKRLEDGQFGICVNCGSTIEEDRLKSMPETPICSACKEG